MTQTTQFARIDPAKDGVALNPRAWIARTVRVVVSATIAGLLVIYTMGVVRGSIVPGRQIDAAHVALIVLAIALIIGLLQPQTFERLKFLEGAGFKVEFEEVKQRQVRQGSELEFIRLVLPVLLPEKERKHLLNLAAGRTKGYKGAESLRAELRRLRSLGLITMVPDTRVGQITDDLEVDLQQYVELTDLGRRWVARIEEIERERPL